ncbi:MULTISPECIES: carboxymuconolactone decarboxylase family protein [unclassified Streptomyces]|uniref:carboxymuconolactone decarboxylase family protein n=1 Tax=unclassified Streptomyces TaxID=2593676 RepID=UPI00403D0B2A
MTADASDGQLDTGMRVRRSVLGDEFVDASLARRSDFAAAFYDYVTRSVWSEVWGRDGLDRRTRSCITLAILTALGREDEIELHTEVAVRNGLDPSEIAEVILHSAAYAGVPMARGAMQAAERTLDRLGALDGGRGEH